MEKTSTRYKSKELILKSEKKPTHLKKEIVSSILSFSKSFQVKTYGLNSRIEYNMN